MIGLWQLLISLKNLFCRHDVVVWMTTEFEYRAVEAPIFDIVQMMREGRTRRIWFYAEDIRELRCFECDKLLNRDLKNISEKPFPIFKFCFDKKRKVHNIGLNNDIL